ncbi:hypothetical protein [Gluconobacter sphaericus]|uniref:Uncharacterized protein n=1 Tax=Gluconobacter sphaericus NBRC 12467 TaxID=1307951 RepID=A0AA37SI02_9PROT|nr:hypothetical protein [Gluconobacter sphaericus]MBF0885510.1 hypothetical protein [Gluconobacter sphaericus]GBR56442.1 hypothetical protein AA12467_2613 [Gluconobacter sphaericus NBRC 12467]GEB42747.1 hypothetical protein GSP01_15290 [Gluconobacter sphaericus NBRC 12467]GLQ84723.1 hypothetical protein GCM10007872_16310 [Gluconobacter sphaericus NBRC 12467]GLQ85122.1 hypothetical protein GCM10007872_20300 [Gluconobacter sphaericus NBRC 12467]
MSDYPTRLEALKLAIEFADGRPMTAEGLIFTSTVIENYLTQGSTQDDGSSVRIVVFSGNVSTPSRGTVCASINNIDGLTDDASDVSTLRFQASSSAPINRNSVPRSKGTGDAPDQSLSGHIVTHSSSSSVLADGESGDSVAADPRNDATTDTSAKGVRDDA